MSTPFPISPAMGRRNHTLAPSTLSQAHASPRSASPYEGPLMSRASKTHAGGYNSSRERQDRLAEAPQRQAPKRVPTPKDRETSRSHALMEEIKRLTAACEAHEREIRASHTTINRQLQDWSLNFDSLNDTDTQAETMSAHINKVVSTTETEHAEKISTIMAPFEDRLDEMAVEFAPWNTYASECEEHMDGGRGSIPRVKAMDGIARLEKQAEVVRIFYEGEEARLKALVHAKRSKRSVLKNVGCYLSTAIVVVAILVALMLYTFEWQGSEGSRSPKAD